MSQFLSMLLMVVAVVLTVRFGVAAWRLSEGTDITGQIPQQLYDKSKSNN